MFCNYLPRLQWKYIQYLYHLRQLQLISRHINMNMKTLATPATNCSRQRHLISLQALQRHQSNNADQPEEALNEIEEDCITIKLQDELIRLGIDATHSVEEILDIMLTKENRTKLQLCHYIHCLTMIWEKSLLLVDSDDINALSKRLQTQMLPILEPHVSQMNVDELSCCYLYLRKMHVPNSEAVMEQLLLRALSLVKFSESKLLPLTALSRLSVGINIGRDFFTPLVCRHFIPHLEHHIGTLCNEKQLHLLAICFYQLHRLIDGQMLTDFKQRTSQLLHSGLLGSDTPKALIKLLHMLNLPKWSHHNITLMRETMLRFLNYFPKLDSGEVKSICRTFLHHQEPAELLQPLKTATEMLFNSENTPDAMACAVPFASPQQREDYITKFSSLLHSKDAWLLPNASGHFFSILRALKISDLKLCNTYWSAVVTQLQTSHEEQINLAFLRHCQHYMNFNNNLGGTYRHHEVERQLSRMCMQTIECDLEGHLPAKFARLTAFVLAYGHTPFAWKKFPNVLLSKIVTMASQFDIIDCFHLSRGMQIAAELRFRHELPSLIGMQLSIIDSVLIDCAERHLAESQQSLSANDLSIIVRTLSHRKSLKNTVIYNQALTKYKTLVCDDLNSRLVRDMAYNFNTSHFFVPEVLDSMFSYVHQHHDHITGDTVEKVLTCAYNLGYSPTNLETLNYAAKVLLRDFEFMSGLSIVQACLALCFYKIISEALINRVFCVKFIQRIEDEIQLCYSRSTHPERVLNLVMQLNRTVCLDFPEANVPWFQQNYIEAQLSKKPFKPSTFRNEVNDLLKNLLKQDNYFRCNHTTPYGYQIDFVIHFDKDKNIMPTPPLEATMLDRITKVAILLLKLDSFCENDLTALRGPESLKIKHLEMMGYKVLHINEHDWNSKYMLAPGAKANYLKCLLQIAH